MWLHPPRLRCEDSPTRPSGRCPRSWGKVRASAAGAALRRAESSICYLQALNRLNLIKMITQVPWGTQVLPGDMHPFPRGHKSHRGRAEATSPAWPLGKHQPGTLLLPRGHGCRRL